MEVAQQRDGLSLEVLQQARALFPFCQMGKIYLNHAGTSPLSTRVTAAVIRYITERSQGILETYTQDVQMLGECRGLVQQLVGAESPDRIALFGNTTDAINVVAGGIDWHDGDRILSNTLEFPANVYPYLNLKRRGVELDFIPGDTGAVTPDMIARFMTPQTRLVALSAVQFLSGYRADLRAIGEMCRARDILFVVDGIQAVGAVSINVQQMKIDALAAGGQKWQMAPHGSGFLYITEDLQAMVQQQNLGWLSAEDPWDFFNYTQPLAASARRYEGGSLTIPSLYGYRAALSTLLEFGPDAIEDHILTLTSALTEQLSTIVPLTLYSPSGRNDRAGIVTVSLPPDADQKPILRALADRGITIALRDGKLRFSPHFYNTLEEIAVVAAATQEVLTAALR